MGIVLSPKVTIYVSNVSMPSHPYAQLMQLVRTDLQSSCGVQRVLPADMRSLICRGRQSIRMREYERCFDRGLEEVW